MFRIVRYYILVFIFSAIGIESISQSSLVISQYIETDAGTTPKGIEIFNVSGSDITFNGTTNLLEVFVGVNGGAFSSVATVTSGTISADGVWVIGTTGLTGLNTTEAFTFNGDDALKIELGGVVQDVFGNPGSDPGSEWSGSGVSTKDQNIQLKDGICDGDTDGWTDPSARFETVSTSPSTDETGFGVAPAACSFSNDSDTELGSVAQPAGSNISSLSDTDAEAVDVFKFTITDQGSGDAVATKITNIRIKPHTTNTADWTDNIQGIKVNDGAAVTIGSPTITDTYIDIPITAGNLDVSDGGSKTITISIYLNTANIADGDILSFMIDADNHGFTSDNSGSRVNSTVNTNSDITSNDFTIEVIATQLLFVQQPSNTLISTAMSPDPTVEAADANGNRDIDYNTAITVTSSGTMTGDPVAGTWSNGLATFASLTHTVNETGVTLTAASGALANEVSSTFNITCSEPANQPTSLVFSNVSTTTIDLDWTAAAGSPDGYIVLMRIGSAPSGTLADGTAYTVGQLNVGGGTNEVAYIGAANSCNLTGLTEDSNYFFEVFSYNCSGTTINYKTASPLNDNQWTTPATQASNINITNLTDVSATINWTNGNGSKRIVILTTDNTFTDPTYGVDPAASASYAGGDQVMYNGSGSSVNITNLTANTTYYPRVYEANHSGTQVTWNTSTATGNPSSFSTYCDEPGNQPTSLVFSNITSSSIDLSWTAAAGAPDGYIVLMRSGSSPTGTPADGTTYTAGNTNIGGGTNTVAYVGAGTSFTASSLSAATTYYFEVYSYNGTGGCIHYLTTAPLSDNQATCSATVSDVSGESNTTDNAQATISWTNPTCFDEIMVIVDLGNVGTTPSGDGTAYTANSVYGSGTNTQDDEYVVYKGTGTSVNVTGLTNGESYCVKIWTRIGTNWSTGAVMCSVRPKIFIQDNDCGGSVAELTQVYSGGSTVNDINFTVEIEHTWRADIVMELESPSGTIVQIMDGNDGGSADNLHITFDDESVNTVVSTTNHTLGGAVDEDCQTVAGETLSTFDGENSNGTWILRVCDDAGADLGYLVDFEIDITDACVPTHTIATFAPSTGPELSHVKITGTGFTGSTSVSFNGTASTSVEFVSSTEIIAEVPTGATTGNMVVTESACNLTAGTFTVIDKVGNCFSSNLTGDAPADLIISEVYDAETGSLAYIEVYNGTGSTINLTGYTIQRFTVATGGTATHTYTFPSSGAGSSIAASEALVGGIASGYDPAIIDFLFGGSTSGFNDGDRLDLYNGATHIDRWYDNAIGNKGFTYTRTNITNTPTYPTTHTPGDWNSSDPETTADLGSVGTAETPPSVTTEPTDNSACAINMSVAASAGEGGTLTYQWKYNDGSASGWSNVTGGAFPGTTVSGETSTNLTISGADIEDYNGYQFYCEVLEDGDCGVVTNGVQFTTESQTFFRTAIMGSGNWTEPDSWEMATSASGPWTDACTYPTAANSEYIHVLASDVVNLDADVTVDQIVIEVGGTLNLNTNSQLTLNNGTGVDLLVEGTLTDNNVAIDQIVWNASSTWQLGANGTIIKTNGSSINNYKDNYAGGIATIPSTATWIIRYDGSETDLPVAAVGMYYPTLKFESNSGFWDASSFTSNFSGASDYTRILGDLDIGGNGTGTVKIYNINTHGTPMTITGDLIIRSGCTLINDDGTTNGTGYDVNGDITIDGTLTLNPTAASNGILELSGGTMQTIAGSGTATIGNGKFNNGSNFTMTAGTVDLTFTNGLTLTNGVITTNDNKIIVSSTAHDAIASFSNTSFINGNLRRHLTDNTEVYEFPLGMGTATTNYFRADIINNNSGMTYLDASVASINEGVGNENDNNLVEAKVTQNGQALTDIDATAEWTFVPDAAPVANGYGIRLFIDNMSITGADDDDFFIVKRPTASNDYADWETKASTSTVPADGQNGRTAASGYAERTNLDGFTKFGIGKGLMPLPVELVNFTGKTLANNTNQLNWMTLSEVNNDYFEIQRSFTNENYQTIGTKLGAGNASSANMYQFIDEYPKLNQINYYRLKQVDFDGKYSISNVVALKPTNTSTNEVSIVIIENNLQIISSNKIVYAEIFNNIGQSILNINNPRGISNLELPDNVSNGTYYIKTIDELGLHESIKIQR